jgi:hypothetical protein
MNAADGGAWFVGDLDDPWVAALADALPRGTRRIACAGDLPEDWNDGGAGGLAPRLVVLHRAHLSPVDAQRLARLRSSAAADPAPRVILCLGPHVRYAELEHWTARGLIDVLVPEATAADTIARHLLAPQPAAVPRRPGRARPRVAVVSTNPELRQTLADACGTLGYPAEPVADWSEAVGGVAVWDVPVLDPDWPRVLAARARLGRVVVLLGFASRTLVRQARAEGAAACLELPYDLLDLGHVLGRVAARRSERAHTLPPGPKSSRRRGAAASGRAGTGRLE